MKCRALIHQPRSVSMLCMKLPVGRMHDGRLVLSRIRRSLYDAILAAVLTAEKREKVRMEAGAAKQSEFVKRLIPQAEAVLANARRIDRRPSGPS
jgi:hypothetical protein